MGLTNKVNRQLEGLIGQDPSFIKSPYVAQRLGLAHNLFNSRMFGAPSLERNIYGANANFNANVQRNATDSSQALALGAAGQGQADAAFANLQNQEAQNKYNMLGNLNDAYGAMANEDYMVNQDNARRYQDKVQLKGAQAANKFAKQKSILNFTQSMIGLGANILTGGVATGLGGGGYFRGGGATGGDPSFG